MTQSQSQSAPPSAPPLLNVADVETQLTEIYEHLTASGNAQGVAEFKRLGTEFRGWRGDSVRANDFLNNVRLLTPQGPVQEPELDPWDLEPPVAAAHQHPESFPVAGSEEETELEPPAAHTDPDPVLEAEDSDQETEAVSAETPAPGTEVLTPLPARPEGDPGNLFFQLRALYERGSGSGWRVMGSFLPDGRQRLVFIDEQPAGLKTFTLDGTDAELDSELAPLLALHLGDPAHEVRTLAAQLAGAARAQTQANKKPAAPVNSSKPAATRTAAKPSTPAVPKTGAVTVTLEPAASASGTFDGPSKNKLKFTGGKASLAALAPGEYTVRVSADGYLESEEKVSVLAGDQQEVTLHLTSAGLEF